MGFNPVKITDFLKEEEDPVSWLVRGLWKKGGYTLISGPPKLARKSWLAERIGLCLSANLTNDGIVPTMQARVLYVSEEGPKIDAQNRLKAQCKNLALNPEDIDDHFFMAHLTGFRLFLPEHMEQIHAWCDQHDPQAVILDPWSKVGPNDGDKTGDSLVCMQAVAELQRRKISVVIVAHTKKEQAKTTLDIDQEIRGSSVLSGAYDTHLALRPTHDNLPIPLTVRNKNSAQQEFKLTWSFKEEWSAQVQDNVLTDCNLEWSVHHAK